MFRKIFFTLVVLINMLILGIYFAYTTEYGAHLLLKITKPLLPGKLNIENLQGSIEKGLKIDSLEYYDNDTSINIDEFNGSWQYNIWKNTLQVKGLTIGNIYYLSNNTQSSNRAISYPYLIANNINIDAIELWQGNNFIGIYNTRAVFSTDKKGVNIQNIHTFIDNYDLSISGELAYAGYVDLLVNLNHYGNNSIVSIKGDINKITGELEQSNKQVANLQLIDTGNELTVKINWQDIDTINKIIPSGSLDVKTNYNSSTNILDIYNINIHDMQLHDIELFATVGTYNLSINGNAITKENSKNIYLDIVYDKDNTFSINGEIKAKINSTDIDFKEIFFKNKQNNDYISFSGSMSFKQEMHMHNINLAVDISKLQKYHSNFYGGIKIFSKANGTITEPMINLHSNINELRILDFILEKATINIDYANSLWDSKGNMAIKGLSYNDININNINVNLEKTNKQNMLTIAAELFNTSIKSHAVLSAENEVKNVRIIKLDLLDNLQQKWILDKHADIQFNSISIKSSLIKLVSSKKNYIKTFFDYTNSENMSFNIKSIIPANTFISYASSNYTMNGDIKIDATYLIEYNSLSNLNASISANNLSISEKFNGYKTKIENINLSSLLIGNGIKITGELQQSSDNNLYAELVYENDSIDIYDLLNSPIVGKIGYQIKNFDWVNLFLSNTLSADGSIIGSHTASGNLSSPKISGLSNLNINKILIADLGINITNISTQLSIVDSDYLIAGSAGEINNAVSIEGKGSLINDQESNISLHADNFSLLENPTLSLAIAGDIHLHSMNKLLKASGDIHVVKGAIKIDDFQSGLDLDNDIIINQDNSKESRSDTLYDINIQLKNPLELQGYGIQTKLSGNINLINNHVFRHAAFGNIKLLDGTYKFINNTLDINFGEINYTGNNLLEPRINISAIKKIGTQEKSLANSSLPQLVGAVVTGSINNPEIKLFAEPNSFSKADILSYLLLGKAANDISKAKQSGLMSAITLLQSKNQDTSIIEKISKKIGIEFDVSSSYSVLPQISEDSKASQSIQESTLISIGKRLSDRLRLIYKYNITDAEQNIQAEFSINEKISSIIEGNHKRSGAKIIYDTEFS